MELQHAADSLALLWNPVAMATHHFLTLSFSLYACARLSSSELIRNNPSCASVAEAEVQVEMRSQEFGGSRRWKQPCE